MPLSYLDDPSKIKDFDRSNYLSHILEIPDQLAEGTRLGESVVIPALFVQAKQIVLLAVGEMEPLALALAALMQPYCRVPFTIVNEYTLPRWVGRDSLVIALDYSGETEQVLATYHEAAQLRARLLSLSMGGTLAAASRRFRGVHITIHYDAPSRVAFPYVFSAMAMVLKKLDFIEFTSSWIGECAEYGRVLLENVSPDVNEYRNSAKQLAAKMVGRQIIIVGSGPLVCIAKKWQASLAATGKISAMASTLGDFNDTIINGISYQHNSTQSPLVIMLQSRYDQTRNKLQQTFTYQVAQAQRFMYEQIFIHPSGSLFSEIVLAGLLGEMVSYYAAWLQNRDPALTEVSHYIKEQLQEHVEEAD